MKLRSMNSFQISSDSNTNSIFLKKSNKSEKNIHNFNFDLEFSTNHERVYYDKVFDVNNNFNISTKSKASNPNKNTKKTTKKISLLINFTKNDELPIVLKRITKNFHRNGINVESDNLLKKRNYFDNNQMNLNNQINLELNPDVVFDPKKKNNSLKCVFLNNIENKRRKYFKQTLLKSFDLDDGYLARFQTMFIEKYTDYVKGEDLYEFFVKCFLLKIPFSKSIYDQMTFFTKTKLVVFFYAKYINMDQFKNLFKTNIESFFYIKQNGKNKLR